MTIAKLIRLLQPIAAVDPDLEVTILHWDDDEMEYVDWPLDTVRFEHGQEGPYSVKLRPCRPEEPNVIARTIRATRTEAEV